MAKRLFQLSDVDPRGVDFTITPQGQKPLTLSLGKFSLMSRIWAAREFGSIEKWEQALFPRDTQNYDEGLWLECLLKTFHHLIEDKSDFPQWQDLGEFLEVTPEVLAEMNKAILYIMGASEPVLEKLDEEIKKKVIQAQQKTAQIKETGD